MKNSPKWVNKVVTFLFISIAILVLVNGFYKCNTGQNLGEDNKRISQVSDLYDSNESDFLEEIALDSLEDYMPKKLKYLNIHCTASYRNLTGAWLLNFFKNERKWSRPGYNLHVQMDGAIDTLVPYNNNGYVELNEISYGVRGQNSHSVNVSYSGGVDRQLKPKDTRTPIQKVTLENIILKFKLIYPNIIVRGHNEHDGVKKACPSFSVFDEYVKTLIPNNDLYDTALDTLGYN